MISEHLPARGRRFSALGRAAFLVTLGAALLAAPSVAFANEGDAGLADRDARSGSVAPSATQLSKVQSLGARATWNSFGTPKTLVKDGGWLATGVSGSSAAAAATNWIDANQALFRLSSVNGLAVQSAHPFREGNAWAVTFRQTFGGLVARPDGTLTVGLAGTPSSGWKIASASSAVSGSTGLAAQPAISAQQAWSAAAADVGVAASVASVKSIKSAGSWKQFAVEGFAQPQRARLVAVPTPANGVRPAWETIVLQSSGGFVLGYQSFVDAVTGNVLVRTNIVENSHPPADVFNGNMQPGDAAGPAGCDTLKGPWTVSPGESVDSIVVTVAAVNPGNDVVIVLWLNGAPHFSQDLLTSPEVMNYDPPGDVPTGTYQVQVCDFEDGADPLPPTNYAGSIVFNEQDTSGGNPTTPPYVARWKAFPNSPLLGTLSQDPWNIPSTDIRKVWCWDATGPAPTFTPIAGCNTVAAGKPDVQNLASRVPWDVLPQTGPTFTTIGNNAFSREAWISPLTPGGAFQPFGVPPVTSGFRDYSFPWTNQWEDQDCNPATTFSSPQRNDIDAAVTNLFAMHNRLHDWDYFLGFTEDNWNAQFHNFFTTANGEEHDPVQGDAQAGGLTGGSPSYLGRDNANMVTTPDGAPPITNMYLWQPLAGAFYAPCVDGDFDMGVIGHEYGHLTENRMIGKGGTRGGHHAGAMGESFGDFHATEYLNEYGYATVVPGQNPFALGAYATGDRIQGIRNYPGNFAPTGAFPTPRVNPAINPLQFGNMGYDITGPQVHADGEIWTKLNFQLRETLRLKYNGAFPSSNQAVQVECADGERPANLCPGNRRWIQLYFTAMLLMPTAPSMLEARNAVLSADMMLFGGANQSDLWLQYARYGFGQFASSDNSAADTDTNPAPDHMSPNHSEATVTFTSPAAPNARVYVGHYEARTSPIADTNSATNNGAAGANGNNLDNVARFVPGTYEFVAKANGYGHIRFSLTLTAGQSRTFSLPFATNWASASQGATATPGVGAWAELNNLIDDTEGTNADYGPGAPKVDTTNPSIIVNLGGTTARSVREVKVSAMLHAGGGGRFTALRSFQILTCNGSDAVCAVPANFTLRSIVGNGGVNAFPGTTPRPTAPELILRTFPLTSSANATHVMIRVLDNQCTGNAAFQGDQDADLANNSDCETGSPGTATPFGDLDVVLAERDDEVHIAELQVFSATSGGGGGGGDDDDDDHCDDDDHMGKLGPPVASAGSTMEYAITFTNTGGKDDDDCDIRDHLSDDLTYVSSTGGGVYDPATRTVTWHTGPVAAGAARTVTLTAKVSSSAAIGSVMMNRAYFGALGVDLSPLGTATTLVVSP